MQTYVGAARMTMFEASTSKVEDLLKLLVKETRSLLEDKFDEVFTAVRRDYLATLGGGTSKHGEVMSKPQRLTRKEIQELNDNSESFFERAFNGEMVQEKVVKGEGDDTGSDERNDDSKPCEEIETSHEKVEDSADTSETVAGVGANSQQADGKADELAGTSITPMDVDDEHQSTSPASHEDSVSDDSD
jgi:hypothetical protein